MVNLDDTTLAEAAAKVDAVPSSKVVVARAAAVDMDFTTSGVDQAKAVVERSQADRDAANVVIAIV